MARTVPSSLSANRGDLTFDSVDSIALGENVRISAWSRGVIRGSLQILLVMVTTTSASKDIPLYQEDDDGSKSSSDSMKSLVSAG